MVIGDCLQGHEGVLRSTIPVSGAPLTNQSREVAVQFYGFLNHSTQPPLTHITHHVYFLWRWVALLVCVYERNVKLHNQGLANYTAEYSTLQYCSF